MSSSLFRNKTAAQQPAVSNPAQMIQQFNQFRQKMAGKNPKEMVQSLVDSGRMSRGQLAQFESQAKDLISIFGK